MTRIRQLGLQLAINPEITPGELGQHPTFDAFQTAALLNYAQLAARYQPENFVIVHEPTTATSSLALPGTTVQQWHDFITAGGAADQSRVAAYASGRGRLSERRASRPQRRRRTRSSRIPRPSRRWTSSHGHL